MQKKLYAKSNTYLKEIFEISVALCSLKFT